jgi:hypothetical protein
MFNPGAPMPSRGTFRANQTLVNGTTVESFGYSVDVNTYESFTIGENYGYQSSQGSSISVTPPEGSNLSAVTIFDAQEYGKHRGWIQDNATEVRSQIGPFVNTTYQAYQSGEINASDVQSRTTLAFANGAEGADGTASYANQLAAYSAMGLSSPDLNDTGTMTISVNGQNRTGMLYTTEAPPGGEWTAGQTYDAAETEGLETFISTDGNRSDLSGNFTVERITGPNGTARQNATVTRYNYVTTNASELIERQARLSELNREIEDRQALFGGGGGFGTGSVPPAALIVVAGGALILILARS